MIHLFNKVRSYPTGIRILTGSLLAILFVLFFYVLPPWYLVTALWSIFLAIAIFEWPRLFSSKKIEFYLIMPFYLFLPFWCLTHLAQDPSSRSLLAIMWILVAVFDSASYFTGIYWGKNKIIPSISPNKTWEGVRGGIVATWIIIVIIQFYLGNKPGHSIIIGTIIAVIALIGDLFESWLKRRAGIKDTGALLPGHGGLLDRLDSLLFVGIWAYLFKDALIQFFGL